MKSITRLSLALIMFSLFSISYLVTSVSADMYNPPPNPSNDPSNTMKSESVDLNKQTLQLHKRITELEQQLNEERAKSEKQLNEERVKSMKKLNDEKAKSEKQLNEAKADIVSEVKKIRNGEGRNRAHALHECVALRWDGGYKPGNDDPEPTNGRPDGYRISIGTLLNEAIVTCNAQQISITTNYQPCGFEEALGDKCRWH